MIQVQSMEKVLPKDKVMQCIQLLGDEYTSLDIIVEIHSRNSLKAERKEKLQELKKEDYNLILSPKAGLRVPKGVYIPRLRKVKLFPFTILKKEYDTLVAQGCDLKYEELVQYTIVSNLYHEIRHAWQHVHTPGAFEREQEVLINDLTTNLDVYQNLATEKDADEFDRQQFTKNASKIRVIFGIESTLVPQFPKYGEM